MLANSKLSKARAGLVLDSPFFGALALRQALKEDPTCKTLWTDGNTIGYNPAFVDSLSLEECKAVIAHEALHVGNAHHARRQKRNARKWNRACDYAINDILTQSGFKLPEGALTGMGTDKASESIYNVLPDEEEDGNGNDPGGCGEVRDTPGKDGPATPGELAQAEAEAKVAISQAAQAAKAAGKLPEGLARMIGDILEAHVPWREVLRRFIDQTARNDYTWTRPSPRYLSSGLYLPSLYSEEMRPLVIAVDTSGSLLDDQISQFASEITAIISECRAHVTVIYCDAVVNSVEEFEPDNNIDLHACGGGGTDFRPPFEEVAKRELEPACLIYLTDGECSRFPDAPNYPVLWGVDCRGFVPPFGEVMEII
jgi:predicted metal-dependent peptidase